VPQAIEQAVTPGLSVKIFPEPGALPVKPTRIQQKLGYLNNRLANPTGHPSSKVLSNKL